jgi:hypothetical protein
LKKSKYIFPRFILIFISVTFIGNIYLQQCITGTVSHENGDPFHGAKILVEDSINGVISDVSGKFLIGIPNGNALFLFTFVGYITKQAATLQESNIPDKIL